MAQLNLKKIAKARSLLKVGDNKLKLPTVGMGLHGNKQLMLADGGDTSDKLEKIGSIVGTVAKIAPLFLDEGGMIADQTTMAPNLKMQYGNKIQRYADGTDEVDMEPTAGDIRGTEALNLAAEEPAPAEEKYNPESDLLPEQLRTLDANEADLRKTGLTEEELKNKRAKMVDMFSRENAAAADKARVPEFSEEGYKVEEPRTLEDIKKDKGFAEEIKAADEEFVRQHPEYARLYRTEPYGGESVALTELKSKIKELTGKTGEGFKKGLNELRSDFTELRPEERPAAAKEIRDVLAEREKREAEYAKLGEKPAEEDKGTGALARVRRAIKEEEAKTPSFAEVMREAAPEKAPAPVVAPAKPVAAAPEVTDEDRATPYYQSVLKHISETGVTPEIAKMTADKIYQHEATDKPKEKAATEEPPLDAPQYAELKAQYDRQLASYDITQRLIDGEKDPKKRAELIAQAGVQLRDAKITHARMTGELAGAEFDRQLAIQKRELDEQADIKRRANQIETGYKLKEIGLQQKAAENFQKLFAEYQSQADKLRQDIATTKLDSHRYVRDIGAVRFGLATLFGVLGKAAGAQGSVQDFLEKKVQQDLNLQIKELDTKKGLLSNYVTAGNSLTNAYKLAKADLKDIFAGELEVAMQGVQDEMTLSQMRQAQAKLQIDATKLRGQAVKDAVNEELMPDQIMLKLGKGQDLDKLRLAEERLQLARELEAGRMRRAEMGDVRRGQTVALKAGEAQTKAQEAVGGSKARQLFKTGTPVKISEMKDAPREETDLMVDVPDPRRRGYVTAAKDKTAAEIVRKGQDLEQTIKSRLKDLRAIAEKYPRGIPLGATPEANQARADAIQIEEAVLSSLTDMLETKTINGGDYERLKKFVPPVEQWHTYAGTLMSKIDRLEKEIGVSRDAKTRTYLRNPDIDNAFDAKGNPIPVQGFKPETAPAPLGGINPLENPRARQPYYPSTPAPVAPRTPAPSGGTPQVGKKREVKRTP